MHPFCAARAPAAIHARGRERLRARRSSDTVRAERRSGRSASPALRVRAPTPARGVRALGKWAETWTPARFETRRSSARRPEFCRRFAGRSLRSQAARAGFTESRRPSWTRMAPLRLNRTANNSRHGVTARCRASSPRFESGPHHATSLRPSIARAASKSLRSGLILARSVARSTSATSRIGFTHWETRSRGRLSPDTIRTCTTRSSPKAESFKRT